ncbi:type II toxin-antitoxin system PemK/MazF family toxin [Levilactobacillus fuyuanensis]|uniref:Type II toxin-antitoxin system PemK/MazF family toxin n=1 Tax=Levilactobacillus fuyuanensis TaxID=2486022 RepID=A0ABW4H5T4_9LACO|nr:type II toxin-antitoxin system PemK/MazF family toxin [Levilactobacillus fuyuanensis]
MSGKVEYPKQGDLVWIDAEPHAGHEYGGHNAISNIRRPMLIISGDVYNERTGMVVGFPITSVVPDGFPAGLKLENTEIHGIAVLSNVLGYDFAARNGEIVDHVSKALRIRALEAVKDIFGIY